MWAFGVLALTAIAPLALRPDELPVVPIPGR